MIQNQENAAVEPPKAEEKKPRLKNALKATQFLQPRGLRKLYEMCLSLNLANADMTVQHSMKKITTLLKTWQFQFSPKYSFDYFIQRCSVLGKEKTLNNFMHKIRRIHKKQDQWEGPPELQSEQMQQSLILLGAKKQQTGMKYTIGEKVQQDRQESSEDEEYLELLMKMERTAKAKKEKENEVDKQDEMPYVPEGYDQEYSDSD